MNKPHKVPLRKCVVTREQHPKQTLIRIVKTKDNQVFVDPSGKMNGRGAYVKRSLAVVDKAEKHKILEKHLGIAIPDTIFNQLRTLIQDEV